MGTVLVLTVVRHPEGCHAPETRKAFGSEGGTIGRSPDNTWHLPDPKRFVSSMHGFVRCDAGRYFMVDTSTNGVFVNGDPRPIGPGRKVRINEGDRIFIGQYELLAHFEAESAAMPPPMPAAARGVDPGLMRSLGAAAAAEGESTMLGIPPVYAPPASEGSEEGGSAASGVDPLARALGLDPALLSPDQRARLTASVGEWVREATRGAQVALAGRNAVKQQFKVNLTTVRASENNPLKFSPTPDEAIQHMFAPRSEAYLTGASAVREVMEDMSLHQKAMLAAMRTAFGALMRQLDPQQMAQRFERSGEKRAFLQSAEAFHWTCFDAQYREWVQDPEAAFRQLFAEAFADAYEELLENADLSRGR